MNEGIETGEICNRLFCKGIIAEHETDENCSCHNHPPCSYCVTDRHYCPECGWEAKEEQNKPMSDAERNGYKIEMDKFDERRKTLQKRMNGELPIEKLDYEVLGHTHFTQKCRGVYVDTGNKENDRTTVWNVVKGTFGGRFERFGNGVFEYIAYTD